MQFELLCVFEGDEFLGQAVFVIADVVGYLEMNL
jgi:hypothetical protein